MERTPSTPSRATSTLERRSDAELVEIVDSHSMRYTVAPNQVATPTRELVRHGWVVEIYAGRGRDQAHLPPDDAIAAAHEALEEVLHTVLPAETERIHVRVDPFIGAVHVQHGSEHAPEVRLRVVIEPLTETDPVVGAREDAELLDALCERLDDRGVRQGS